MTGCAGFIGSHLTETLLDRGQSVVGIDCFNDNYGRAQKLANLREVRDWDAFEFVPIDMARGDLQEVAEGCDVVYHLAAEPGVRSGWGPRYEQFVRNNVIATQHLLEALKDRPGVPFVHTSSSSVYGDSGTRPTPEDAPTVPMSPYGQTKLSGEQLCAVYAGAHGLDWRCLRYFTVYGPRQRPDMALHSFLRAALEGTAITVFGDGLQTRDFTYVADVVGATLAAADAPEWAAPGPVNVGGGSPVSVREALDLVGDLTGRPLEIHNLPAQPGDVTDTEADASLARELLGWEPSMTLREGLVRELEWLSGELAGSGGFGGAPGRGG